MCSQIASSACWITHHLSLIYNAYRVSKGNAETYFIFSFNEAKVFQSPRDASAHLATRPSILSPKPTLAQATNCVIRRRLSHNFYWTVAKYTGSGWRRRRPKGVGEGDKWQVKSRRHLYKLLQLHALAPREVFDYLATPPTMHSLLRYAFMIACDICMQPPLN